MKKEKTLDIDQIRSILNNNRDEIMNQYRAEIIGLFGSYSRRDVTSDSDIDLLIRFEKGTTLFGWAGLINYLEDKLGVSVDVVPEQSLKKELRSSVYNDLIEI